MKPNVPLEIMSIFRDMYKGSLKRYPGSSSRYKGEEGFKEYVDMVSEDLWNLHGRVETQCEDLSESLKHWAEQHYVSKKDVYKVYVYVNRGSIYKGSRIRQSFKNKGILYEGVLDCDKEQDHEYYINNLHPDTSILLYHGTDEYVVACTARRGMDLNVPPRMIEKYTEVYEGGSSSGKHYRKGGIYVSPFKGTSGGFGSVLFAMVKQARHLYAPNWEVQRAIDKGIDIDEEYLKLYPDRYANSFRPSVSYWLLAHESQALLKQSIRPGEILYVSWYDRAKQSTVKVPIEKYKKMFEGKVLKY